MYLQNKENVDIIWCPRYWERKVNMQLKFEYDFMNDLATQYEYLFASY
jgi:hypothetical protein